MRCKSQICLYPNALLRGCLLLSLFIIIGSCFRMGTRKMSEPYLQKQLETSYYENGNIEYEAELLNGKLDGMSRHWSENGNLLSESEYSNGIPHGKWNRFHQNGKIMHEVIYFHGEKHGREIWHYETGTMKSEQTFNYGKSADDIIRWNEDGSIIYR